MPRGKVSSRNNFFIPFMIALLMPFNALAAQMPESQKVRLNLELGQKVLPAKKVQKSYIKIGLEGFVLKAKEQRPPINVALVLDRSGSMSGKKIKHAKEAAIMALDYLQKDDTLAVITYDDRVNVLVPSEPFRDRAKVERAIEGIKTKGRTALHAGVTKGAAEVRKFLQENNVNRVILISDGLANIGPSTPAELGQLGRKLGGEGISVTTVGLGLGYNEDLMVKLAGASDGNHVFAEKPSQLAEVFRNEFGDLTSVVAGDVIIIIQCRNGVKPLRSLGREAKIKGDRVEARLNQLYSSQEKYVLLEVETPVGQDGAQLDIADIEVSYNNLVTKRKEQVQGQVRVSYSGSDEEARKSVNKTVMVSASEQIGADMDDQALELKDKGDVKGAEEMLKNKADYLAGQAKRFKSERLEKQSLSARKAQEAVAAPAASATWNKARKAIRADQYSIKKQQSFK